MELDRDACYRALLTRDARFDGRFFSAVKTTGIFCRPICPARVPKRANLTFFATAAEALGAGYRPCLRCRPEASPDLAFWRGTSNSVSRALRLISEGALDEDGVDGLAARLGLGERHLRRLFQRHLGVSPIDVAQTRRLLFAKKLITETAMPLAEVALAAGFGSVRRFNAEIRRTYARAPRELRRSHGETGGGTAMRLSLPYSPPYDWPMLLAFLGARAIPGVESVADGAYRRTIAIDGAHGTVEVRPAADGSPRLMACIRFPKVTALPTIVGRLRRVFDLGADPAAIAADLSKDPILAPLLAARPGLRVPGAWDGFELAVRAILGQQVTVVAATKLAGKLVALYGERLQQEEGAGADEDLSLVFPRPERIADIDLARTLGMPRARGVALSSLARAAASDARLFHPLQSLEEAVLRLRQLPGIGEWTAHYIAMRALHEPDAFPTGDIGLLRAMATPEGRPSPAELLAAAEAWRPWRAYATLHLWMADAAAEAKTEKKDGAQDRSTGFADRHDPARL
ncbi:MAG: helix-turn-helix domain-containing protein [Proteobacteria bacterium]|nr:helix-turn-helix domain-containing protein [Pseudomonadota bacterium]MBI3496659.1 helix-turn-helix domain-containing protein [Pseudomonadota bacterium]